MQDKKLSFTPLQTQSSHNKCLNCFKCCPVLSYIAEHILHVVDLVELSSQRLRALLLAVHRRGLRNAGCQILC